MMRLFIAMNFPASIQRSIAAVGKELKVGGVPARWVPYGDMHLTLKFLGELPSARLAEVTAAMEEVAAASGPVLLKFGRVGAFPSPRSPRVIWIGVDAGPRLRLLHDALDRRMAKFGVEREDRPFRPHVTVGRTARHSGPGEFRDFERHAREMAVAAEARIESIDLMESRLRSGGAEYGKLASARLLGV